MEIIKNQIQEIRLNLRLIKESFLNLNWINRIIMILLIIIASPITLTVAIGLSAFAVISVLIIDPIKRLFKWL